MDRIGSEAPQWTVDDIPDQQGRVAVVTGANSGIGLHTARALARRGATVVLACRDRQRAELARDRILAETRQPPSIDIVQLDLGCLDSVKQAAAELAHRYPGIDLLINNAGVMWSPERVTHDGFEVHFGTNHLGHFALTGLLLDQLLKVAGSRVVTVSSIRHRAGRIDFESLRPVGARRPRRAYAQSKLANLMFTFELQRRLAAAHAGTIATAAHPGGASTNVVRHTPALFRGVNRLGGALLNSPSMAALPTVRAAVDQSARGGDFYGPGGFLQLRGHPVLVEASWRAREAAVGRRLWSISERLTGVAYQL